MRYSFFPFGYSLATFSLFVPLFVPLLSSRPRRNLVEIVAASSLTFVVIFCYSRTSVLFVTDLFGYPSVLLFWRTGRVSSRSSSRHVQVPVYLARLPPYRPESTIVLIQDSSLLVLWLSRRCFVTSLVLDHYDRHYHEFFTGFRRCFTRVNGGVPPLTAEYSARLTSSG